MTARNGEIELDSEVIGGTGEPLLLVMGIGQMLQWSPAFCDALIARGFRVARFDNRDAGRSTHLHHLRAPGPLALSLRPGASAPYRLEDMADDTVAVLDDLGWERAHLVGVAQGAMIAQQVAVRHPHRVRTLTSISSSPSTRIGRPTASTVLAVLRVARRRIDTRERYVQHLLDLLPVSGSPAYPPDEDWLREVGAACFDRGHDQAGVQRQSAAFQAAGDRRSELAAITAPTLVVHGEQDRLIRVRRARHRRGHSRRATAHLPRNGQRPPPRTVRCDRRRHRRPARRPVPAVRLRHHGVPTNRCRVRRCAGSVR